ncbi:MAG: mechanosensitive ion channel family protein [Bdellovibrionaceae bacterium]|nr:mechanosensitive ion channel family protein [Pseudobdellovibrionaceae bacterium]MBX3035028.1 mechanosensitive ion channel family protein [Pseudobdellovibrionaceae bacterium]
MPTLDTDKFLQVQVLYSFLEAEPYVLLGLLAFSCWLFYYFFLQDVSEERHRNLKRHFQTLTRHFLLLTVFFGLFLFCREGADQLTTLQRLAPYFGFFAFLWGAIVFVKSCRLWVLQYLFMQSMREGVPLLIVNVFSLLLSGAIAFWAVSRLFGLQLGPLVATSAAFSIILGLAMQDTLGNLFAGISLQIDKNFEIGDWVEVVNGIQRCTGQVKEISWRSVLLVGFSDELITVPNRVMAQAQISNFSPPDQPIVRSQLFRLPYGANVDLAKDLLERAAAEISEIRGLPAPLAYVHESTDSWLGVKLIYFLDSYGAQFTVGDKVLRKGVDSLAQNGIQLARTEYIIHRDPGQGK